MAWFYSVDMSSVHDTLKHGFEGCKDIFKQVPILACDNGIIWNKEIICYTKQFTIFSCV